MNKKYLKTIDQIKEAIVKGLIVYANDSLAYQVNKGKFDIYIDCSTTGHRIGLAGKSGLNGSNFFVLES